MMMRKITSNVLFILLSFQTVYAQDINLETNASFWIGNNAIFFAGGNTTLNGTITNNGTIASFSDLDFVLNQDVGNLLFNGDSEQVLSGDSLLALNVSVDKAGDLILLSNNLIVQGTLDIQDGVIQSAEEDDLLVTGSSQGADGYVEGKLVGITTGSSLTFPMGVNGSANYVTLNGITDTGVVLRVICQAPQSLLLPDEEMVGIADQVEWIIQTVNGETMDAQLSVDYSGLDFTNFSNGAPIRSNGYEPAIAMFFDGDTLYHSLNTSSLTETDAQSGQIVSSQTISIDSAGRRFSVAWIPIIVEPVVYIPNSFAPESTNDDNRIFRPYFSGETISQFSMKVIDSFKKVLYEVDLTEDNIDLSLYGWDGSLKSGKPAENGLYYYSITLTAESETHTRAGTIFLIK